MLQSAPTIVGRLNSYKSRMCASLWSAVLCCAVLCCLCMQHSWLSMLKILLKLAETSLCLKQAVANASDGVHSKVPAPQCPRTPRSSCISGCPCASQQLLSPVCTKGTMTLSSLKRCVKSVFLHGCCTSRQDSMLMLSEASITQEFTCYHGTGDSCTGSRPKLARVKCACMHVHVRPCSLCRDCPAITIMDL